jgi:hypothetical protein
MVALVAGLTSGTCSGFDILHEMQGLHQSAAGFVPLRLLLESRVQQWQAQSTHALHDEPVYLAFAFLASLASVAFVNTYPHTLNNDIANFQQLDLATNISISMYLANHSRDSHMNK